MAELLLSLVSGILVGILFTVLKLPLPAPPVLSGVLGIIGIWLGGKISEHILYFLISKIF